MKKKDYLNAIHTELGPFMAERGFELRKSRSQYLKRDDGRTLALAIDVLKHSGQTYRIHMSCHIGFARLEEAYLKHHIYARQSDGFFSLSVNCGNIMSRDISANLCMGESDATSAIHNAKLAVQQDVLPFLDRYSRIDALVANLEDSNWRARVTSDPMARAAILLSHHALAKSRTAFAAAASDLLQYCSSGQGVVHKPFADELISGLEKDYM